jgi:hypothetical protein
MHHGSVGYNVCFMVRKQVIPKQIAMAVSHTNQCHSQSQAPQPRDHSWLHPDLDQLSLHASEGTETQKDVFQFTPTINGSSRPMPRDS